MIGFRIRGLNDIVWGFGDPEGPVSDDLTPLRLIETPEGIMGAGIEQQFISTVTQAGATHTATQDQQNKWKVKVQLRDANSAEQAMWLAYRWRKSIGRGEVIQFEVVGSTGSRFQDVRLDTTSQMPHIDYDLLANGWYFKDELDFISESSWFYGDALTQTFTAAQFAGAKAVNEGDVDGWPTYEVTGPITSPALGVAGEVVTLTGATVPAGSTWVIVTDPEGPPTIRDKATGANKMRTVYDTVGANFLWTKPVPAESTVAATISGTGTSGATRVKMTVPQRYRAGVGWMG